ncbi:serine hydrolase domain-containing protein [Steroidobacter sp.]|uniref:serine hydrolase domain-containing protein n=1 Tax=Steroidobacter sp. TaxID=1978227 RepID=UPI001A48129D|nr:serine hydrolase domain-containing protein [Steroidobacter sp.]MBL8271933.1 beta-lactamase family protein [Steroidobacter sp.]
MKSELRAASTALALLLSVSVHAADKPDARIRVFESSLRSAVSVEGQADPQWTVQERMAYWKVPGMSIAVIRDGKLAWAKAYGVLQVGAPGKVDTQTMFSVGSVSKVGAAALTLRMVDAGKLDLDADVNGYLARWKVPENAFTSVRPVTLRGILSHTAGFSVSGFKDYAPHEPIPTQLDTLEGRAPAKNNPVRVEFVPGTKFQYSGGGITVEQLIVEDVAGVDFNRAARQYLFDPLGMKRSSYENPLPAEYGNIAKAHDAEGRPRALPRGYETMPEMAASGLWTSPSDYAKLVIAIIESYQGKTSNFLSSALARQMLSETGPSWHGLGPVLKGAGLGRAFFHHGSNDSYKAYMEGHPNTGDGVIVFTNATNGKDLYPEVVRAVAVAEQWAPELSDHWRINPLALTAAELNEFTGIYERQSATSTYRNRDRAGISRIFLQDGSLHLNFNGGDDGYRMIPIGSNQFVYESMVGLVLEFVRNYDGQIGTLLIKTGGDVAEFKKTPTRER